MNSPAADIAAALANRAEAVCRRYLSNGRREGRYWLVGNVHNTPGRSLFVRLEASPDGSGAAGKWTDAENGDHGDLLDMIALACSYATLRETLAEARAFLNLPPSLLGPVTSTPHARQSRVPSGTPEAARRLLAASKPLIGSLGQIYLASRGITNLVGCDALRFHPRCFYRASPEDDVGVGAAYPAIIAAVTDLSGSVTGVHRSWLAVDGSSKAEVAVPRRAMGHLLGGGVRFGRANGVMIAGEGIETVLSLRQIMPAMPMMAALSAAHLAAIFFPGGLRRLYVARDDDQAGAGAVTSLMQRAVPLGIEVLSLEPMLGDFNDDLTTTGRERLMRWVKGQLLAGDAAAYLGR